MTEKGSNFCLCACTLCRFFSLGGRLSRIIFMALSGGSLKYGGSPSTISITMIPRDQISTWRQRGEAVNKRKGQRVKPESKQRASDTSGPYGSLDMSSGAIQYGVPTRDFLLCTSLDTWAQKPKSDSFTWRPTAVRRRRKKKAKENQER